ncbi:MAG TPA: pyridoxamine 5'-phosphate oxidase family protein [Acidobacteriaceae bacterium]|nr:pyridoxamine 5'-phosphate oxidase family protein [Acidobacteriaceae bacterium]
MTPSDLYTFITAKPYAVLSTLAANGTPQSALVGIAATPDLEIIFDTLTTTRKYANLLANPTCSLVIGWDNEQTLQYEGTAFFPSGPDLSRYQALYFGRWPDGPARLSWPGLVHIVIRPTWLRYSDFNQQPPMIKESHFATASS